MKINMRMILLLIFFVSAAVTTLIVSGGRARAEHDPISLPDAPKSPVVYTVQKGEGLWSIARKFDVDLDLLAYANERNSDSLLAENEEIVIPFESNIIYSVKEGDTLWAIAQRFDTTVEELTERNTVGTEGLLVPGQILTVTVGEKRETRPVFGKKLIPGIRIKNWPVAGVVTSTYGPRKSGMHHGLDIAAEHGEPIRAVEAGTVIFSGYRGIYGKTVIIRHGIGSRTVYGHASELEVEEGEKVEAGQVIARVGSTGQSTGPHVHLELWLGGKTVDPEKYLPKDKM